METIVKLSELLKKRPPENLEMLRMSHCKIDWKTSLFLLETLQKSGKYLKKLELVSANLN
jgi:hypothetical protein